MTIVKLDRAVQTRPVDPLTSQRFLFPTSLRAWGLDTPVHVLATVGIRRLDQVFPTSGRPPASPVPPKSCLVPSQATPFVGVLDSVTMTAM